VVGLWQHQRKALRGLCGRSLIWCTRLFGGATRVFRDPLKPSGVYIEKFSIPIELFGDVH
jgi:hypothetical protein